MSGIVLPIIGLCSSISKELVLFGSGLKFVGSISMSVSIGKIIEIKLFNISNSPSDGVSPFPNIYVG